MSDTNMIPIASEEYEALLPTGWAEGDDIFDMSSWGSNAPAADEQQGEAAQEEANEAAEANAEETPAIESAEVGEESGEDGDDAPATEQPPAKAKLKFSVQVDHKMQDVELDETELPTIFQKAHVTDRLKAKIAQNQPLIDKGNRLAKILGYDSMDAMLDAAEKSYRDGEIERLTGEGVHPDVAAELVDSRASRAASSVPATKVEEDVDETPGARDFTAEVADLLTAHPELRGTRLPEEVVQACVVQGRPLSSAFEEYSRKRTEAENKAVKAENKRLKQNADAAKRAPVRGVSKGGATNLQPDDPFLIGFNSDRW